MLTCPGHVSVPPVAVQVVALAVVQASVVDTARAINAVSLAWGLSSGSLTNIISMGPTTGDFWQTSPSIPKQSGGTSVFYQITAVDDSGSVQTPVLSPKISQTENTR